MLRLLGSLFLIFTVQNMAGAASVAGDQLRTRLGNASIMASAPKLLTSMADVATVTKSAVNRGRVSQAVIKHSLPVPHSPYVPGSAVEQLAARGLTANLSHTFLSPYTETAVPAGPAISMAIEEMSKQKPEKMVAELVAENPSRLALLAAALAHVRDHTPHQFVQNDSRYYCAHCPLVLDRLQLKGLRADTSCRRLY